jgi:hypothetical protein
MANAFGTLFDLPTSALREHWDVNVGGPHVLYQATLPLLLSSSRDASTPPPKFISISSTGGSIAAGMSESYYGLTGAYGASKATLNYVTRKIHFENEKKGLGKWRRITSIHREHLDVPCMSCSCVLTEPRGNGYRNVYVEWIILFDFQNFVLNALSHEVRDRLQAAPPSGPYSKQSVEDCAKSMFKIIDEATRESSGGKFLNGNGEELPW